MAFFGRNASRKPRKLPPKTAHTLGSFSRGKEADLASSSLTLLLTKQALSWTLAISGRKG
jgi:hypothetical protein